MAVDNLAVVVAVAITAPEQMPLQEEMVLYEYFGVSEQEISVSGPMAP
jgi:hypothetical protein